MSPMEVIANGFKNDKREVYNLDILQNLNIMNEQEVRELKRI